MSIPVHPLELSAEANASVDALEAFSPEGLDKVFQDARDQGLAALVVLRKKGTTPGDPDLFFIHAAGDASQSLAQEILEAYKIHLVGHYGAPPADAEAYDA